MRKAQSFIVEFVLFFMISFSLFAAISYLFYSQNIYYKKKVGETTSDLVNDLILTHIIEGINCKACDEVMITEEIPSKIGGIFYVVKLNNSVINTTLMTEKTSFKETPIFNLNETLFFSGTSKSEDRKIVIKINNTNVGVE
ncbi:MAG: hypothetical protein QMD36_02955 [Candidatus Aenigmarchaeota archaeon]|nr:hypothetical protein [Candidatus Aenigmarchaeota archaeon]